MSGQVIADINLGHLIHCFTRSKRYIEVPRGNQRAPCILTSTP